MSWEWKATFLLVTAGSIIFPPMLIFLITLTIFYLSGTSKLTKTRIIYYSQWKKYVIVKEIPEGFLCVRYFTNYTQAFFHGHVRPKALKPFWSSIFFVDKPVIIPKDKASGKIRSRVFKHRDRFAKIMDEIVNKKPAARAGFLARN